MADIANLQVTLTPPSLPTPLASPASIPVHVAVRNNADYPVTVLTWGTPLDPRADILGVFSVRDHTNDDASVPLTTIKINRRLPADHNDLVEIPANASIDRVVTLSHVPLVDGHEYAIQAEGVWHAVWQGGASDVTEAHLERLEGSSRGQFVSNKVDVKVE